ncbi:hypothetical protein [Candidatus Sarmatiella mevalonica]|uniref:hypothetical protein n=1 Tax=Candidatus Sarmatiella mevalonica TaxID=2770581 RepID=UPI0019227FC4|nr:hypothetical protein [Candidatus Sarmatiella mevalonica]
MLSKLLCAPHILEYAAALNIIFPKNSSFIFRLCKRSNIQVSFHKSKRTQELIESASCKILTTLFS